MRTRLGVALVIAGVGLAFPAAGPSAQPRDGVAEYTASYDVDYKQRNLGTATFSVAHEDDGTFVFESRTEARGLLHLLRPNALVERSRFKVVDGKIRPMSFDYEDGSRKGEGNFHAEFDWTAGIVVVEGESGRTEYPLEDGVLDRGSMQVALMRDLARGDAVGPYMLADDDGVDTYRYEHEGEEPIETPAGEFDAQVYVQRREGSSRILKLWVVPSLEFLPVRLAQFRDDELLSDFKLESVKGLQR